MGKSHQYQVTVQWTGNLGKGTSAYNAYSRDHQVFAENKLHKIQASSDPSFRGSPDKYNPEEMFLSSLSACHMLWYLHLCASHGIVVKKYIDRAEGTMTESEDGSGYFSKVTLKPEILIEHGDIEKARKLHADANNMCFIANSCNFEIDHEPIITVLTH